MKMVWCKTCTEMYEFDNLLQQSLSQEDGNLTASAVTVGFRKSFQLAGLLACIIQCAWTSILSNSFGYSWPVGSKRNEKHQWKWHKLTDEQRPLRATFFLTVWAREFSAPWLPVSLFHPNVSSELLPWNTCAVYSCKPIKCNSPWNQLPHTLFRVMEKDTNMSLWVQLRVSDLFVYNYCQSGKRRQSN